jgi:hypothetical protein
LHLAWRLLLFVPAGMRFVAKPLRFVPASPQKSQKALW